jgi:hypothetical protein
LLFAAKERINRTLMTRTGRGKGRPRVGAPGCVDVSKTVSLSHDSGDDMLIRAIDGAPPIQNLTHIIYVLRMAGGKMNHLKSDHDFNLEIRGGHVWIDARASLRAEHRTE